MLDILPRLSERASGLPQRRQLPAGAIRRCRHRVSPSVAAGVVVRDMRATPGLGDALRITVGLPEENDAVFAALRPAEVAA